MDTMMQLAHDEAGMLARMSVLAYVADDARNGDLFVAMAKRVAPNMLARRRLRSPAGARLASVETGRVHGPELPHWGMHYYRLYMRLCACGAVETGFQHDWHDRGCARFAS